MEKLAVIAKVLELAPIEGADRIDRATVLGWHVVVKKGLHKVGDLVVMVFPDSFAPKAYVDETYVGEDKTRIKTVKMRGQYSAGLVLPVAEVYAAAERKGLPSKVWDDGEEVSVLLDIEKWVAPVGMSVGGDELGDFPTRFISRTDELNFRSEPAALAEAHTDPRFKNVEFVATLKMDGTSATYIKESNEYHDGYFYVCGRNKYYAKTPGNVHWRMSDKYKIEENLPEGYAIQGEICGLGIQANPMKFSDAQFLVYRVKNLKTHEYLGWDELKAFCRYYMFHHVPEVTRFVFTENTPTIETLQELANNAKYDHGRVNAEGVVILPVKPIRSMALQKPYWSLKVMNQPYDMKKG
jgi:RNA ligase (TIGR02306 family)